MSGQASNTNQSVSSRVDDVSEFYQAIDRRSLIHKISQHRPYVYTTMEVYDASNGFRGAGGLGVLAADTRRIAQDLEIPFVTLTPFYQTERHQSMTNLEPNDNYIVKDPLDEGFTKVGQTTIQIGGDSPSTLDIYQKILGTTRFLSMTEPNFGPLYSDHPSSDHRLYQMVALGFAGYQALKMVNLKPAVMQLNETATVFAAIARLDELCRNGMNIYEAIVYIRKHTLYTNHTLVQAAESEFNFGQFEKFVFPNIKSPALRHYIGGLFRDGKLRLSSLTIELAEAKNGVSRLHAKVAEYYDLSGERVHFDAITNGIHLQTWVMPEILDFYHQAGIIDKFNMPTNLSLTETDQHFTNNASKLRDYKKSGRQYLNDILQKRKNQYGEASQIPDDVVLFEFKRRFVEYKRPWMPFADLDKLKQILVDNNAHYIMAGMIAGNVDRSDSTYQKLEEMLHAIADDPILRERVHYITDYDEELAKAMSYGADISINVPIVGLEACGTSFMKDIANLTLVIATNDGGIADVAPPAVFLVDGESYQDELAALYRNMEIAAKVARDDHKWVSLTSASVNAYLPTICGTRMMRDYLRYLFRKPGK